MLFWIILKVSLRSLLANKLRSFLAMLGIIIGVGAVISMLALGAGARQQMMARISSMGSNLLIIRPGDRGFRGVTSGTYENLTQADAQAIMEKIPAVYQMSPVVRGNAQLKYFNKNTRSAIMGGAMPYFSIRNFEIERGRAFTEDEVARNMRVAVLGAEVVQALFEKSNPLGEKIKVKGINFQVIGILKSKGDQGWHNPDNQIIVPYTTAMKQLFGLTKLQEIDVQANPDVNLSEVESAITKILRQRHRIRPESPDDFHVRNQADIIEMASDFSRTFTILLGGIASISLLVGGIGIMNIMLVTVTERTREIGIRKAIGAKERHILQQFLIEAILMSSIGGMIGVGVGMGIANLISHMTRFTTLVEIESIILSLSFSAGVGIFFGFYPSKRAARLDPIEALRYE